MQNFDIIKTNKTDLTFRVSSIIGKFDLQSNETTEHFKGQIDLSNNWKIGLIVGKSGSGKTTIAKQLFKNSYITKFEYKNKSILDDMPKWCSISDITNAFNSVGFSSPPSWLKPYSVLSNGEKMRCDLARSILEKNEMIVFDEFTSVLDRNVAKIGSFAIQKAIRKSDKKFIAVGCHYDVEEWLMPDWVFNTDTMTFHSFEGQKKNRPEIKFNIYKAKNKSIWKMFAKHHYLSHTHNNAAHVYLATINNEIAGFLSVLHLPHPHVKNIKKVHRLVILPDYQGAGFGVKFLNEIGKIYKNQNYRYSIVTSAPSLIYALKKSNKWMCKNFGRLKGGGSGLLHGKNSKSTSNSKNRITASFEMK